MTSLRHHYKYKEKDEEHEPGERHREWTRETDPMGKALWNLTELIPQLEKDTLLKYDPWTLTPKGIFEEK